MDHPPIPFETPLVELAAILAQAGHYPQSRRGVYFLIRSGQVVHVGHSPNVCRRLHNLAREGRLRFDQVSVIYTQAPDIGRLVQRYAAALLPAGVNPTNSEGALSRDEAAERYCVPRTAVDVCCAASPEAKHLAYLVPSDDAQVIALLEWIGSQQEALGTYRWLDERTVKHWIEQRHQDAGFRIPTCEARSVSDTDVDGDLFDDESSATPEELEQLARRIAGEPPSEDEDLFA